MAGLQAGQYVGSAVCNQCHPAQFERQALSEHARALSPDARTEWAFGAGAQTVTYVSQVDAETYREHGLSYYAATKSMGLTPGHSNANGALYRTFDPGSQILRCFQCHSTGPLRLAANNRIQVSEAGVRCESCHGPGADHVKGGGDKAAIFNPARLTAAAMNDFCGACHRKPASAGDDTNWKNPWNSRHQPLYLSQSACFRKSKGALTCLTCHKPHAALERTGYDAKCSACHPLPRHRSLAATAKRSCTSCHMPAVRPQPNLAFANHWIGIYLPPKASLASTVQ